MHLATMWQSCVEIKDYSIVYDHTAFEVPYRWTSAKSGAHTRFVDSLDIQAHVPLNAMMPSKYVTE